MSELLITIIDVGWGDSILIESTDSNGRHWFGLIDSNDTIEMKSSLIYIRRRLDVLGIDPKSRQRNFEFVMLSHAHADHGEGLLAIFKHFGTENFWYPESNISPMLANLLRYAGRSSKVGHFEAVDRTKLLPNLGDAAMEVLWPRPNRVDANENNNSIVLTIKLGKVVFVLSGDAEVDVWVDVVDKFPRNIRVFKVPHHGAQNGTIGASGETPWLDHCPKRASLAISSHVRPHHHPNQSVLDEFDNRNYQYFRTDENHHLTFVTDGKTVQRKYSRF